MSIVLSNPILQQAYEANWYFPPDLPSEILNDPLYEKAVEEGWHEWIETPLDFTAVKKGYAYDLSRDVDNKPIYWIDGHWQTADGSTIPVDDEADAVGYVGRGDHMMRFCETFLNFTKEPLIGTPFRFLPWMRKVFAPLYGWVNTKSKAKLRRFNFLYLAISKKNGKALSDDTRVPTPDGWKNHGDLKVGDEVFDARGKVCKVIAVHPKTSINKEVKFTNGESIKCNGEHLWVTESLAKPEGGGKRVRSYYPKSEKSTDEISRSLKYGSALNHRIEMHDGLECPDVDLPIDPYVLGFWLGDGGSTTARVTIGDQNLEESKKELMECGCFIKSVYKSKGKISVLLDTEANTRSENCLLDSLRGLGLIGNKHIPKMYLRASKSQRLALLQGLMDTDGTISKCGKCITFCQKCPVLTEQFCELAASLGIKFSCILKDVTCTNTNPPKKCKAYLVQFHSFREELPVFRLKYKLDRMRSRFELQMKTARSRNVHISDVVDIEPVQGNCITVSGDGTYLCGKTMVPTHNSYLISAISNYMLVADGTPKAQAYICACDRNQAKIIYDEARNMATESQLLAPMIDVVDSQSRLVYPETASFLKVLSADAHRNDGVDSSFTGIDEIHRHPNRKLFGVMERAGRARPEPMLCVITTYGPSTTDGSIWAEIHNEAKAQMAGDRPDSWRRMNVIASSEPITVTAKEDVQPGATRIRVERLQQPVDVGQISFDISQMDLGENTVEVTVTQPAKRFQTYIEVAPIESEIPVFSEAVANKEWNTLHGVLRSNPSAGVIFDPQDVLDEAKNIRGPEMEAETKQLSFNITSGSGKRWISAAVWQACGEMQVQPKALIGRQAFAAIDFSWGGDLVALGVAVPKWDMSIPFLDVPNPRIDLLSWAWVPDEMIAEREEKEQFPYRFHADQPYLFDDKGSIRICKGSVADFTQIVTEATEILRQFQILAIAYDPNYAQFSIPKFVDEGFTCIEHKQGAVAMGPACKRFRDMVHSRQIAHGNNPVLNRAVEGAVPHPPDKGGNIYLSKGNSKVKIDPLVSHVMSVNFCTNPPVMQSGAYADSSTGVWG